MLGLVGLRVCFGASDHGGLWLDAGTKDLIVVFKNAEL